MALVALATTIHLLEIRIVIGSLPGQDLPVIEANRVSAQVPFADEGGSVSSFL